MKCLSLLTLLSISSIFATKHNEMIPVIADHPNLRVLKRVENVICRAKDASVYHDEDSNFFVRQDSKVYYVDRAFIGKELREIPKSAFTAYLAQSYLTLNQMDEGRFSIKSSGKLSGGGAFGATVGIILGKAAVHAVGHSTLYLISFAAGPAQTPTFFALEGLFAAKIEAVSIYVAAVAGITLGVASGPA